MMKEVYIITNIYDVIACKGYFESIEDAEKYILDNGLQNLYIIKVKREIQTK